MEAPDNKTNKVKGWVSTLLIHGVLALLFLFLAALRPGDRYDDEAAGGVESALGFEENGQITEEIIPEEITEPQPIEETPPAEPVEEETPTEEAEDNETPDVVKPEEKPKEKEKPKEVVKPKEDKPKTENLFNRKSQGNTGKDGQQGSPNGNPDEKNIFNRNSGHADKGDGNADIGEGSNLDIKGWKWDRLPTEQDPTSENGYVRFKFTVDEDGTITNVTKVAGANLTISEDNFYKKQLLKISFTWKDDKVDPPASTTGYYTFRIRSK